MKTRKQDACQCFLAGPDHAALCAIVCDGAGSAGFGGEGAAVIARTLTAALRDHFGRTQGLPSDEAIWEWLDFLRDRLAASAAVRGKTRRDFASTLVMLVVAGEEALVVHVGDGAVVVRDRTGSWRALSWPENGEYASTTYFVTDDPEPRVRIGRHPLEFDAAAVFSDGIEQLALDVAAAIPHEPFFRSMIAPLDGSEERGQVRTLSRALAVFLDSARVCERTDDDKSLILASCR